MRRAEESFARKALRSRRAVTCGKLAYMRIVLLICGLAATEALIASDAYPPPRRRGPPARSRR